MLSNDWYISSKKDKSCFSMNRLTLILIALMILEHYRSDNETNINISKVPKFFSWIRRNESDLQCSVLGCHFFVNGNNISSNVSFCKYFIFHWKFESLLNGVPNMPTCPRALRALRALRAHAPYVSTCPTCSTCPRAHVYFTDRKIKKWKLCTHMFIRVLSLVLDLNFAIS